MGLQSKKNALQKICVEYFSFQGGDFRPLPAKKLLVLLHYYTGRPLSTGRSSPPTSQTLLGEHHRVSGQLCPNWATVQRDYAPGVDPRLRHESL